MKKILLTGVVAAAFCSAPALAADVPVKAPSMAADSSSGIYWQLEGVYVFKDPNSGSNNGFGGAIQGHDVGAGRGYWTLGHVGYVMPSGWDWRLGGGYAKLGKGDTNGLFPPSLNIWTVNSARMYNIDADVGFTFGGPAKIRPFFGVRYLNWNQKGDLNPAAPITCCFLNSEFSGVGPLAGIDLKSPITFLPNVSFVAGGDVAGLFGDTDFQRGTFSAPLPATGSVHRTVWNYGAYAGFDWQATPNASIGIKYRFMALRGASFVQPGFSPSPTPSGMGTNHLHGPSLSLTVKY